MPQGSSTGKPGLLKNLSTNLGVLRGNLMEPLRKLSHIIKSANVQLRLGALCWPCFLCLSEFLTCPRAFMCSVFVPLQDVGFHQHPLLLIPVSSAPAVVCGVEK